MYFYAVLAIVIYCCQLQVKAATTVGNVPSGQIPLNDFKDANIRQFVLWIGNVSQSMEDLWPAYAGQMLLQSETASRMTEYADAITADSDFNQTCIAEQKQKYTALKLQLITDFRMCNQTQALTLLANITVASQPAWQQLRELDKKLTSLSARCQMRVNAWFLNSLINMLRDLCKSTNQNTMNNDLRNVRDTTLMELYRKSLSIMMENGKQLQNCLIKTSANALKTIQTNIQDAAKCVVSS